MNPKDERYYIERILDGETDEFSVFLERYSRPLYTLIVQIVGSPEDAEELVQDVFLNAFRRLDSYKKESRFSTWLYRIAYNAAISATRKRKQECFYLEEHLIDNVSDNEAETIVEEADNEEKIGRLCRAIDRLTPEEKALITLYYYEERSVEEISEVLRLTPGNVKVKLHRTRKKLYVLMNEKLQ